MKILSKKNLIAFVAVIILSIVAFSGLSFLFADEENGAQTKVAADVITPSEGKSIIDYIIDNSYNLEDGNDSTYHVLEISSGGTDAAPTSSKLKELVNEYNESNQVISKNFEDCVINGNKSSSQDRDMNTSNPNPNIEYTCKYMNDTDANLIAAINKADLIYFSEDPSTLWTANHDISEDVKNALSKYAVSDMKPIIFDDHALTIKFKQQTYNSFTSLISNTFYKEGYKNATFMWPDDSNTGSKISASVLMNPADITALYTAISGKTQQPIWVSVEKSSVSNNNAATSTDASSTDASSTDADVVGTTSVAKVLTITKSSNMTLTNIFKEESLQKDSSNNYVAFTKEDVDGSGNVIAKVSKITDQFAADTNPDTYNLDNIYLIQGRDDTHTVGSSVYEYGYASSGLRPQAFQFETIDLSTSSESTLASIDYSKYDFVIIENGVGSEPISEGTQLALRSAMYSKVHILYDSKLYTEPQDIQYETELKAKNVAYVYDKIATSTGMTRYDSVMITARAYMQVYATYPTAKSVKPIADIINSGSFRGITISSGDSSTVYTVLEIEPCYPINTELAKSLYKVVENNYIDTTNPNNKTFVELSIRTASKTQYTDSYYYLRTDAVSDLTSDEISYDEGQSSLTDLLDDKKAGGTKLSDLITQTKNGDNLTDDNMPNVVDYYNWTLSKAKIAHATGRSYNKVNVVHMSAVEFATSRKSLLDNYDAIYIGGDTSAFKDPSKWNASGKMKYYTMYSHNGDIYTYPSNYNEKSGQYGVYSGIDITESKLTELKEYAKKMPVIISNELTEAYKDAEIKGTGQSLIDPECNMYKFLDSITTVSAAANSIEANSTNVLIHFDHNYTYKAVNVEGMYGNTYGGYATVFRGEDNPEDYFGNDAATTVTKTPELANEKDLKTVLNTTARPLFAVTSMPSIYSENDSTTWIDITTGKYSKGLTWKIDCSVPCKVKLYFDDNSDGKFTAVNPNEIMAKDDSYKKSTSLTYKLPSTYYGVIYWKVEVESENGLKASTVNVCKVKRTTQPKMHVNLLNIMPISNNNGASNSRKPSESVDNIRTLYLCTDCQYAGAILEGTGNTDTGIFRAQFDYRVNSLKDSVNNNLSGYLSETSTVVGYIQNDDPNYSYAGNKLGIHKHDFGIVKYYDDLTFAGDTKSGFDDPTTNWFNQIRDDYDVDMTMLYSDDYETMVGTINSYFANMNAEEVNDAITGAHGFVEKKNRYEKYYSAMQSLINGTYPKTSSNGIDFDELDRKYNTTPAFSDYMESLLGSDYENILKKYADSTYNMDTKLAADYQYMITDKSTKEDWEKLYKYITDSTIDRDDRKYSYIFNNYNAFVVDDSKRGLADTKNYISQELINYYCDYRDAMIIEQYLYDTYQEAYLYSSYDATVGRVNLKNVYDCMAIGAADFFNYADMKDPGCNAILDFQNHDGTIILFHDALNAKNTMTTNMTSKLSTAFGQNARHKVVSTGTTINSPNNASIYVNDINTGVKADMGKGVQSRNITIIKSEPTKLEASQKPFTVSVGDASTKVDGNTKTTSGAAVNLDSKEFNLTYEKSVTLKPVIELQLRQGNNSGWEGDWFNSGEKFIIDPTVTNVSIDVYFENSDLNSAPKQVDNFQTSGYNAGTHNITVTLNFKKYNGTANPYNFQSDKGCLFYLNGSKTGWVSYGNDITFSSTNVSSTNVQRIESYKLKELSCSSQTLSEDNMTTQNVNVTVVESGTDTKLAGETVSCSYNGSTVNATTAAVGEDCYAIITKNHFNDNNYKLDSAEGSNTFTEISTSDGTTDTQTLTVKVIDKDRNPISNAVVRVEDAYNGSRTANTNATGEVSFVAANYTTATTANPKEVPDGTGKVGSTYDITNKGNNTYTSRMLTYKAIFQQYDTNGDPIVNANDHYLPFKYTFMYDKQCVEPTSAGILVAANNLQADISKASVGTPTNKTKKNNEGIITKYPFGIGDRMFISSTAPGDYATDIEDDDLVVYYTMAGGSTGSSSSLFAADPMDGRNNYFIYQYGSVYYTGAGYALITGHGRNNNDERKLYINIIVNSGRKSTRGPSVKLYDHNSTDDDLTNGTANDIIKESAGENYDYFMEIEDLSDFEGFDFLASISDSSSSLSSVSIWFDIDHTDDGNDDGVYECGAGDVPIFDYPTSNTANVVEANELKTVDADTEDIKHIALNENYFDVKTNKNYCYIVVQVTDSNGISDSVTLRIQYKPALIDLD